MILNECIREGGADLRAALDTLGKSELPQALHAVAEKARTRLCDNYKASSRETGLQGPLIEAMAKAMGDPDIEVVRWIVEEAVPIGIDVPIKSCGVFPSAEPVATEGECEALGHGWNDASYEEHRADADKLLQRELDLDWVDWQLATYRGSSRGPTRQSYLQPHGSNFENQKRCAQAQADS